MTITVTQQNPLSETLPHAVTNNVIKPVMQGSFLEEMPGTFVSLGRARAEQGWLRVDLPAAAARGRHVIGLRATPPGMSPRAFGKDGEPGESEQVKRLRALGYVQ